MHKRFFNFSSDGSVGNIDIFGSIGEDWWADDGGNTAKKIKDLIDQVSKTNCSAYHVRINSLGGEVDAALAIHRLLASLPNVTTECIGFCASAATVIFMAGKERLIAKNALFLIHKCSSRAFGNENKIRRTLEEQQVINNTIRSTYVDAGCDPDTIDRLMNENDGLGRWLSADEALQHGFATAIADTNNSATNTYNSADFTDANLPIPSSIQSIQSIQSPSDQVLSPSLMQRIRNFVQDIINSKPSNTMPENNTNPTNTAQPTAEQKIQTLTAERDQARNERNQAITERDQARTERDQAVAERDQANHRAEELQALIDQTPNNDTQVNGDDEPAPEDPVSDFISNSPAYQAIKEELYN